MIRAPRALFAAVAAASLTAACATAPVPGPAGAGAGAAVAVPTGPAVAPEERVRRASAFLGRGQRELARHELAALMAEQPDSRAGKSLLDQLDRDPRALLGERNFPYKVRPGETLPGLAGRFLGDRLLFYALARYNGIEVPDGAMAGRTLLIPGTAKKAAPAPRTAATAKPPADTPGARAARASALRRAALEHMSKGTVDKAVALLQQAAPLDPANPLIRADLDRALRIQASVRRR